MKNLKELSDQLKVDIFVKMEIDNDENNNSVNNTLKKITAIDIHTLGIEAIYKAFQLGLESGSTIYKTKQ